MAARVSLEALYLCLNLLSPFIFCAPHSDDTTEPATTWDDMIDSKEDIIVSEVGAVEEKDEVQLARMGYRQELR